MDKLVSLRNINQASFELVPVAVDGGWGEISVGDGFRSVADVFEVSEHADAGVVLLGFGHVLGLLRVLVEVDLVLDKH